MKNILPALIFSLIMICLTQANPAGETVTSGSATVTTVGNTMTITTGTARTIMEWNSFSNANGETTNFIQPSASSAVLNRVTGAAPSILNGQLTSNGAVYLLNPNGITLGSTGTINTNGFVASTLNVADSEFLAGGNMTFSGTSTAKIEITGLIANYNDNTAPVYLIAKEVALSGFGNVVNSGGRFGIGAGTEVLVTTSGDERITVLGSSAPGQITTSLGRTISATVIELKAAGGNPYALAINHGGASSAGAFSTGGNGKIYLKANNGVVSNPGSLWATNGGGLVKIDSNGAMPAAGTINADTIQINTTGSSTGGGGQLGGGGIVVGGGGQTGGVITGGSGILLPSNNTLGFVVSTGTGSILLSPRFRAKQELEKIKGRSVSEQEISQFFQNTNQQTTPTTVTNSEPNLVTITAPNFMPPTVNFTAQPISFTPSTTTLPNFGTGSITSASSFTLINP